MPAPTTTVVMSARSLHEAQVPHLVLVHRVVGVQLVRLFVVLNGQPVVALVKVAVGPVVICKIVIRLELDGL